MVTSVFASEITVLLITYNEEPNIGRVLARLSWAHRIVVVDSGSTDATLDVLAAHPAVEIIHRPFDTFSAQCNFGLEHVRTPWALSLDADYVLSESLITEIQALVEDPKIDGYRARFVYKVNGRAILGSLYPPRVALYRIAKAHYANEGHGHRVRIDGRVANLRAPIYHDDRKPLGRWLDSQRRYAQHEAAMLLKTGSGGALTDRLRRTGWVMPLLVPLYVLFVKGGVLSGCAGWMYALQRTLAEIMVAIELLDRRLASPPDAVAVPQSRGQGECPEETLN